jgi:DAK2 domain fusion protein YloV
MNTVNLSGEAFKNMLIGGAENIKKNSAQINDLNVFPVPDGDTGTNMTKTMEGGVLQIAQLKEDSVKTVMERFSRGLLLGARGNSGVILSQIFAGIREVLCNYETVNAQILAEAYESGIKKSYASVSIPTEGTILTVFRESVEYAKNNINKDSYIEEFYKLHIEEAKRSLKRTKEILPVLAEADVIDSGGAGYLCIAMGMYSVLTGELNAGEYKFTQEAKEELDFDLFKSDSEMKYGYCTEFLLRLTVNKVDVDAFSPKTLISELEGIGGDSIVAYKEGDIVKVHVHIMTPGRALETAQRYGEFLTLKIENMALGHSDTEKAKGNVKKKRKKLATVAVAKGEGICALFKDMGADCIVSGGQTDNPSTEEFLSAFEEMNADSIIVLPNNKNVMLAAQQAEKMYEGGEVYIVPTYTLMEGYGALSVITTGVSDVKSVVESAERAAKGVLGSEITSAVRDVTIDGVEIKKGDYIAITDGHITAVSSDSNDAVMKMLGAVDSIDDYEILTLFVGLDVDADKRVALTDRIEEIYPELEIVVYEGKQELYDYLIALE